MARKRKKTKKQKIVELEALEQINLNAAGLDIGAAEIYVAVPEGCGTESVRCFQTYTRSLHFIFSIGFPVCGEASVKHLDN